jgi:TRAP-type C4-dicarboxylate transport system substrate-binding protein
LIILKNTNTVTFNFEEYFRKLGEASDGLSRSFVKREKFQYYDSLSKTEQQEFKDISNEYLRKQHLKFREQINTAKQMMIEAGIPIS